MKIRTDQYTNDHICVAFIPETDAERCYLDSIKFHLIEANADVFEVDDMETERHFAVRVQCLKRDVAKMTRDDLLD